MILSTLTWRLRGEGIKGLGTTAVRLIWSTALALDVLLAWWIFHGIDAVALIHAGFTVLFGWLGATWGHGAFQRPHVAVLYQITDKINRALTTTTRSDAIKRVTTEKHAMISRALFGRWSDGWSTMDRIKYQVIGMAETGVLRVACIALPFLYLQPVLYPVLVLLGALAGPAYWIGWHIWVKFVDDIHDAYALQKPIKGFLYGGDHVGDLLHGFLWVAILWLGLALHNVL